MRRRNRKSIRSAAGFAWLLTIDLLKKMKTLEGSDAGLGRALFRGFSEVEGSVQFLMFIGLLCEAQSIHVVNPSSSSLNV
jgi:hypothetical protein